ncbi:unnamed protein product [Amoebophrya sp. A120]|nr:unnamed protein product [Amoebophrya sp. A120]|eukprot:GSA120T00006966001.1
MQVSDINRLVSLNLRPEQAGGNPDLFRDSIYLLVKY